MLNLTEPYSPFSTTTFEALTLRGTLKANTHFSTPQKSLLVLRACQDTTTTHAHTKKPETKYPTNTYPSLIPLVLAISKFFL